MDLKENPEKILQYDKHHVIENVPYASQEAGLFCAYACPLMIFNYCGINSTLDEVLYFSGVGHSLLYSVSPPRYLLTPGYLISQSSYDRKFLADLYGLSYEYWQPDFSILSDSQCWQEYWHRVKRSIAENIPVLTNVNVFFLFSKKKKINMSRWLWNLISSMGVHSIVLVGFDENNGTVCYNDPLSELRGEREEGIYSWIDIKSLRNAVGTVRFGKNKPRYSIEIFRKTGEPLPMDKAFIFAHKRNIERMNGIPLAYAKRFGDHKLGIHALETLKKDFEEGTRKNQNIIPIYARSGLKFQIRSKLLHLIGYGPLYFNPVTVNVYGNISIEKLYALRFLEKNSNLSNLYKNDKKLLKEEIEIWQNLALYFANFFENIYIGRVNALNLIKNMNYMIDNAISIEKMMISQYSE